MIKDFIVFYTTGSRQYSLAIRINLIRGSTLDIIHQALIDRIRIDHELKEKETLGLFKVDAVVEVN